MWFDVGRRGLVVTDVSIASSWFAPGGAVNRIVAVAGSAEAASIIPRGGGAVAILIAGIVVAVICATVAIELHRNAYVWTTIGFVGTVILLSAINEMVMRSTH
jgi:hypothetical protein